MSIYPKFRDDLVVSEIGEGDKRYFVIKDPVTRKFFRLRSPEYFIAGQLDGKTSPGEVRRRFEEKFDSPLDEAGLDRFLNRLRGLCLLAGEFAESEYAELQRRVSIDSGLLRRLLYIRLKAVDPDRFFERLLPRIGFFFTTRFVLFTVLVSVAALAITVSSWSEYVAQVRDIFRPSMIPTFLFVVFTVTALHELAHGVTCKFYGGSVHEVGFMLIYLLPAFYCNVSDAWLLEDRKKRLWVSFAGPFFQIFVWAVTTVIWRLVEPGTWLSDACGIAMATSGLTTLFNFNPLIKLDGYYILSDYLGAPNLRRKAFGYLGDRIRALLGMDGNAGETITVERKRIYLLYGLSAGFYSFGLLLFIGLKVAGFIISIFHEIGLIAILAVCFIAFLGSIEKRAFKVFGADGEDKGLRKRLPKRYRVLIGLAIIAAVLFFGVWELKVSSNFRLLPFSRASIRAGVAGIIHEIYVKEGEDVEMGDPIVRLDTTGLTADIKKIEAETAKRRAELELLVKGPIKEEIVRLQKLVERERTKVSFSEKEFRRISELYEKNLIAPVEYERAQEQSNIALKELEHAESDLDVLLAGSRPEEIDAARAEIARLQAESVYLAEQIGRTEIRSPITGVVATHRFMERLKEHVDVGDKICEIVDCSTVILEISVSEKDVAEVEIGQRVKLKTRSLPGRAFYGKVTAIAPVASMNDNHTVFIVTSEVENSDLVLRPGMTGKAKIYCGKRRIITLLTRKIVRFIRVEFLL